MTLSLSDDVCKADIYQDIWQHSKHYMLHIERLRSGDLLLATKSCVQI